MIAFYENTNLSTTVLSNTTNSYVTSHTVKTLVAIKMPPPEAMMKYIKTMLDASIHGMNAAFNVTFGFAIFAFLCALFTRRSVPPKGEKHQGGMH